MTIDELRQARNEAKHFILESDNTVRELLDLMSNRLRCATEYHYDDGWVDSLRSMKRELRALPMLLVSKRPR